MRIPLAKYGVREVGIWGGLALAGALVAAVFAWYLAWVFVLGLLLILYFFRDPQRRAPAEPGVVVAPADGRVVEVAEVEEGVYMHMRVHKIAVFMSPLNVHVNRAPCSGRVETVEHRSGRYKNAADPSASAENECVAMVLGDVEGGRRVLVRQVAGLIARRIVCAAAVGEYLERGQRFGMIKFGSRAEVYVPADGHFVVAVRPGERVRAGETVVGRFS